MYHFRKPWVRVAVLLPFIAILNTVLLVGSDSTEVRSRLLGTIPSITLLFAVTAALTLAVLSNAVFGLRSISFEQARRVRELAWEMIDEYSQSEHLAIRSVIDEHVKPLVQLRLVDYQDPDKYSEWSAGMSMGISTVIASAEYPP